MPRLSGLVLLAAVVWPMAAAAVSEAAVWCHRVREGDTLWALARRYRTTLDTLGALNGLDEGRSRLRVGQLLAVPALERLRRGELRLVARPLAARQGALRRENRHADRQRLSRLADVRHVRRFVRARLLVPLPVSARTYWVDGVPARLRVARPWTKRFVEQVAAAFHHLFGKRLKITSLTRPAAVQRTLQESNGNAAPAHGDLRSTHLTGASVDISKRPLLPPQTHWLRRVLSRLARQRLLHAVEEFSQPHFHVMVFRAYRAYARKLPIPVLIGGC